MQKDGLTEAVSGGDLELSLGDGLKNLTILRWGCFNDSNAINTR